MVSYHSQEFGFEFQGSIVTMKVCNNFIMMYSALKQKDTVEVIMFDVNKCHFLMHNDW